MVLHRNIDAAASSNASDALQCHRSVVGDDCPLTTIGTIDHHATCLVDIHATTRADVDVRRGGSQLKSAVVFSSTVIAVTNVERSIGDVDRRTTLLAQICPNAEVQDATI